MIRAAVLLVLLLAGTARAADAPPDPASADAAAIRSVITRQIEAFGRDDAPAAYGFAAPNIRLVFPSAPVFMDMVRRGYPSVYHPRSVEFSELATRDGELVQEVELIGPDGKPVLALYSMVRDGAGGWLISACRIIPSVRLGS